MERRRRMLSTGRVSVACVAFIFVAVTFYLPDGCGWWRGSCDEPFAFTAFFAIMYWVGVTGLWITVPVMIYRWIRFRTIAPQRHRSEHDIPE